MRTRLGWAAFACGALLVACGGSQGVAANVDEGPMPSGGSFTGVWFSPQYGRMDMVQNGSSVIGRYVKDERKGDIQGTVEGNVLRFEWRERRELVSGRPTITRGRGYFRYAIDANGEHKIVGEWGHDDDEVGGGPWNAVKSRRLQPNLSNTSEEEGSSGGSDWDEDSGGGGGDTGGGDQGAQPQGGQGQGGQGGGQGGGGHDDLGDL